LPIQCGFAIYGICFLLAFHLYQIKRTMIRKTNEQKLRSLIKNLHTIEVALLVERIETMMKLTLQDIEEKPESYDNWFVSHHAYVNLANKVIDQLKP
jgi:chemotaxis signal transduction protein